MKPYKAKTFSFYTSRITPVFLYYKAAKVSFILTDVGK